MRSTFILLLLLCMIAPMAAMSAVDESGATKAPVRDSSVRFYSFGGVDEPQFPDSKDWGKEVSLDVKDVTFGEAVKMLLKNTDIKYMVDPQVLPLKVTAVFKNVALRDAMREIAKASGATLKTQDNILHILPAQPCSSMAVELQRKIAELVAQLAKERVDKTEDHPSVKALERALEALEKRLGQEWDHVPQMGLPGIWNWYSGAPSPTGKGGKTQIFVIKYINPAELVPLVYALGARQVTVVSGGKLVINGTEEVIKQAADMVNELDTEEALPRPIRVQVRAQYIITDKAGKRESLQSATEGTVAEGEPISLHTAASPENEKVSEALLLEVGLTPEVGQNNRVTLAGKVSILTMPGVKESSLSDSSVAVSVLSGKPEVISSGTITMAGTRLEYEVTAIATIGEGRLRTRTKGGFGGGGGGMLIAPGLGGFQGMGGFGGDSECFDPTQWSAAFDAYGERMNGFAAAMDAAAEQWRKAFDGFGGGFGGFGGQDSDLPDCSSGGGGGGA